MAWETIGDFKQPPNLASSAIGNFFFRKKLKLNFDEPPVTPKYPQISRKIRHNLHTSQYPPELKRGVREGKHWKQITFGEDLQRTIYGGTYFDNNLLALNCENSVVLYEPGSSTQVLPFKDLPAIKGEIIDMYTLEEKLAIVREFSVQLTDPYAGKEVFKTDLENVIECTSKSESSWSIFLGTGANQVYRQDLRTKDVIKQFRLPHLACRVRALHYDEHFNCLASTNNIDGAVLFWDIRNTRTPVIECRPDIIGPGCKSTQLTSGGQSGYSTHGLFGLNSNRTITKYTLNSTPDFSLKFSKIDRVAPFLPFSITSLPSSNGEYPLLAIGGSQWVVMLPEPSPLSLDMKLNSTMGVIHPTMCESNSLFTHNNTLYCVYESGVAVMEHDKDYCGYSENKIHAHFV